MNISLTLLRCIWNLIFGFVFFLNLEEFGLRLFFAFYYKVNPNPYLILNPNIYLFIIYWFCFVISSSCSNFVLLRYWSNLVYVEKGTALRPWLKVRYWIIGCTIEIWIEHDLIWVVLCVTNIYPGLIWIFSPNNTQ